ncbi:DUF5597 domain-containing protein [Microbacterium yannicii]|uniref:DUF5597 domain-containing protein n=1 Tax=Microbacterium yannicii TaxID=671622 RepID=A0ABP9MBG3_9MICO|nr:DUF5597 domain-containing protein [Microbacterium yannicii]MCO5952500.1 DUF5597 domain-containing protein [Microbacterium yannicii]
MTDTTTKPTGRRPLPTVRRNGAATHLFVDGEPYLALGGELHNSSASSPEYMAPVWDHLAANGVGTVIGTASWQLVEPDEGRFDFTAVDDQIAQAQRRGIRLVLIWFGAYKNAESTYAPSWVRRDDDRFTRAERDPANLLTGRFTLDAPVLSVFDERLRDADARAFAELMAHIAEVDVHGTVIAVQVENEVGLLGDSRDRSPHAAAAWGAAVPAELLDGLAARGERLHPHVRAVWERNGARASGTWAEVFGTDGEGGEIFMSWGFSRYVDAVARAGIARHALPVFANAWLGPQPNALEPGRYPSGGPVARMLDVWQIGAPTLAFLSPDIYVDDFDGTLAQYAIDGNPIYVPEAKPEAALAFIAVGAYRAIGFNPFGIEDLPAGHEVFRAYEVLNALSGEIVRAHAEDRIHGFRVSTGEQQRVDIGGFEVTINGPFDTRGIFGTGTGSNAEDKVGYGLVLRTGEDEFLVTATSASLSFARQDAIVEIDELQEEVLRDGLWVRRRTLNGDERHFMFYGDDLRTVRISLLRRPRP